jgi:hypothetical protein
MALQGTAVAVAATKIATRMEVSEVGFHRQIEFVDNNSPFATTVCVADNDFTFTGNAKDPPPPPL